MNHRIFRSFLLLVLIVFPVALFAQGYEEKLKAIDAYAQQVQRDWKVPGVAVAVVKDDRVIFAKGYGVRELGKQTPVDEHTVFAIASNSKAFATASLAILIDEKKIGGWDDKVSKYLPDFEMPDAYVTRELTIRDLVSHRSGLGTFSGDLLWYEANLSTDEILEKVRLLKPWSSFRASYHYQNLMFIAAGRIVEKVSGKPWGEFVRERILTPLGMNNTKTSIREFKPGDNIAMPHNESGGKGMRVIHYGNVDAAAAAAGLNSTAADLAKWLRLQLGRGKFEGKQIFSEQQSVAMWQQVTAIPVSKAAMEFNPATHFSGYGLGWQLSDYHGRKMVAHGGALDGMFSATGMLPEENLGVVVLTNSETSVNTIIRNKVFDVFLGVPARDWSADLMKRSQAAEEREKAEEQKVLAARIASTRPSLALSTYTGTFSAPLYGDATVTEENGRLVVRLGRSPNLVADLEHWHYDTFEIKWRPQTVYNFPRGWVIFTLDRNGKPFEMKIDQPNGDFWFYELEFKRKQGAVDSSR